MKKLIFVGLFFGIGWQSYGQSTTNLNIWTASRYLGYVAGGSGLLEVKTEGITRMNMQSQANSDYTSGRVTMGNNIATAFTPQARLHMFQFGTGTTNADMFRTDGHSSVANNWRMFTGTSQALATEKFIITAVASTVHATLQTTQANSVMGFNTGGAFNRMQIVSGGISSDDGRVALSNNGALTFAPAARLHMYQFGGTANGDMLRTDASGTVDNNWRMFTGATQAAATEKFRLFIPANTNNVVLQTTQPGFMQFNTQATGRAKINPTINYSVNGFATAAHDGYYLIGQNANLTGGTLYDNAHGAFTLLHLSGPNPSGFAQEFGYRPWMQTG